MAKSLFKTKTFWVNVIAAVSMFGGSQFGITLTPEQVAAALAAINVVLRAVTKEEIVW